jgi:hypothetical protein
VKRESRNSNSFSLLLMFGVWNYKDAKSLLCVCMLRVLLSDFFTSWLMMISPWYNNLRDSRIWWQKSIGVVVCWQLTINQKICNLGTISQLLFTILVLFPRGMSSISLHNFCVWNF